MRIFDFSNHDDAVQASDAVDISQGIEHEVLIILHVSGIHLDLEIVITGGVVAFRYLVDGLHGIIVIGEIKDSHYIPVNQNKEKRN